MIVLEVGMGAKRRPEAPTGTPSDGEAVFVHVCPVFSPWANLCLSIWLTTNKGRVSSKINTLIYIYIYINGRKTAPEDTDESVAS